MITFIEFSTFKFATTAVYSDGALYDGSLLEVSGIARAISIEDGALRGVSATITILDHDRQISNTPPEQIYLKTITIGLIPQEDDLPGGKQNVFVGEIDSLSYSRGIVTITARDRMRRVDEYTKNTTVLPTQNAVSIMKYIFDTVLDRSELYDVMSFDSTLVGLPTAFTQALSIDLASDSISTILSSILYQFSLSGFVNRDGLFSIAPVFVSSPTESESFTDLDFIGDVSVTYQTDSLVTSIKATFNSTEFVTAVNVLAEYEQGISYYKEIDLTMLQTSGLSSLAYAIANRFVINFGQPWVEVSFVIPLSQVTFDLADYIRVQSTTGPGDQGLNVLGCVTGISYNLSQMTADITLRANISPNVQTLTPIQRTV